MVTFLTNFTTMFDWEDQELANIVWGETGENEDHIVPPYEERNEVSDQKTANVKLTEKSTLSVTDSQEGSYTHIGKASADGFGSLPDLSPSNATKLHLEHTDEKAQVDSSFQNLDSQSTYRVGSDFVDYSWANVGSFDDLDRILRNNNLVLWSSSSDEVPGCSGNSELLSIESPSSQLGVSKSDCQHVETESFVKEEKQMEKSASDTVRRNPPFVYPNGASNVSLPNEMAVGKHAKMSAQIKSIRCQGRPPTSCDPWFYLGNQGKEFEGQHRQLIRSSSSKTTLQENSLPFPPGYNMMGNQHAAVPTLSHQQVSSSSSYLLDNPNIPLTPMSMTPQEKIEKLRRRQKMRALLAIRKQQQKFSHKESQMQFARAGNVEIDESLGTCMSLDVSSPLEQSDSDTRPVMLDKNTLEDNILHQLQKVIATLGIEIRLCIRDSLFRLAESAFQRKNYGDTVSTSRRSTDEPIEVGLSSTKSSTRTHDGETKTNPIDRAVAQLLFHTPPESLICKADNVLSSTV